LHSRQPLDAASQSRRWPARNSCWSTPVPSMLSFDVRCGKCAWAARGCPAVRNSDLSVLAATGPLDTHARRCPSLERALADSASLRGRRGRLSLSEQLQRGIRSYGKFTTTTRVAQGLTGSLG